MEKIVRPETMERITTKVLADAFIEEQPPIGTIEFEKTTEG